MSDVMTPLERYIVGAWGHDRLFTVDSLLAAARYAIAIGRSKDAEDMAFCAQSALALAKEES